MCGLMGYLSTTGDAASRVDAVAAGMQCARHRGPDERGTWQDQDVVFGFNRLSIIDIEHAHQPLRWGPPENPQRYALVFNGEIYNYLELRAELAAELRRDRSHTDGRRRGDRRRLPPLGRGRRRPAARHVRLPHLGHRDADAVRRPRPVRHQAAVLRRRRRHRLGLLLREEGPPRADRPGDSVDETRRAALPGAAVRAGARDDDTAIRRLESGTRFTVGPDDPRPQFTRYFHPVFMPEARPAAGPDRAALYDEIADGARRLGGQAHARRRHGGRVPVRRYRLDGDRRAGHAAQPAT